MVTFAIPAYIGKRKDKRILYLAMSLNIRNAFKGIWKTLG